MAIRIGSNISSIHAQGELSRVTDALSTSYERLSSGLRINKASDDAAGLSIASTLQADTHIYTQAIRNINDGISLLNVAEGAVHELGNITIRQKELAEQAASGTYSTLQRQALDSEDQALTNEYNRIIQSTKFNGVKLLDGSLIVNPLVIQAGSGANSTLSITIGGKIARKVGDGTFSPAKTWKVGNSPNSVTAADLNGDGVLDLITSNQSDNTIGVSLGNGDGTFKAQIALPSDSQPTDVKVVRLTSGSQQFLVSADSAANTIDVFAGNGDGTFKAAVSYATTGLPGEFNFGDLTGSGKEDLVLATPGSNVVDVFIGNGDGTFTAEVSYAAGNGPRGALLVDLNGDGKLDVAVGAGGTNSLGILVGNGDGTFKAPQFYPSGVNPRLVNTADFNGDGIPDLVVANRDDNTMSLFIGNGDGSFKAQVTHPTGGTPKEVSTADLNGDGMIDLVTSNGGDNTVGVYLGNGDGSFKASLLYNVGALPQTPLLRDLNGDGVLDITTSNFNDSSVTTLLGNTASVTTLAPSRILTQSSALSALETAEAQMGRITTEIGDIGALQSRLTVAMRNLSSQRENETAANSRIMDADVATETASLTARKIRQEAASAVLAQANQEPALALKLLAIN